MKKTKKAGGWITYIRALSRSYNPPVLKGLAELLPVCLCSLAAFLVIYQTRAPLQMSDRIDWTVLALIFALVEFIMVTVVVSTYRHKPNLQSLYPMEHGKKVALRLTGGLLLSLFWYIIIIAALFVILALPFLFLGLFVNMWEGMLYYFEMYGRVFTGSDGMGYAFLAFWAVLSYGAGVLCGAFEKNSFRYIAAGGYLLVSVIFTMLSVNAFNGWNGYVLRGAVLQNFSELPLAWLWLAVFIAFSAGICAFAVVYAVKKSRRKDF